MARRGASARKGDALERAAIFKRAIDAAPSEPGYLVNYGLLLAQRGDSLRAAEFLERAAAVDRLWSRGHAQLGELALSSGQIESAEQRFRTALRADPGDAQAHIGLAQVLLVRGDNDQALAHAQAGIEKLPEDSRAQTVLGMVLLAKGHHAFARQALDNALRLDPFNVRVRHLATRRSCRRRRRRAEHAATPDRLHCGRRADVGADVRSDLAFGSLRCHRRSARQGAGAGRGEPSLVHAAPGRSCVPDTSTTPFRCWVPMLAQAHPSIWSASSACWAARGADDAYALARDWAQAQPSGRRPRRTLATGAEMRGD
ncbi:MAG: tetratricopeptide repeat protein, partial [Rhodanobacteraceae bacterium]|nr:tetratricopeptide repeat protein [Rhodanobacteraceae bacterium]